MPEGPFPYEAECLESPFSTSLAPGHQLSGDTPEDSVDEGPGGSGDKYGELKATLEGIARMAKKTIREAISEVLRAVGQPMTTRDIYEAIARKELYDFKAKDPASTVRSQLRRHCVNMKGSPPSGVKHFRMTDDGRFDLLQSPEDLLKDAGTERIDVFVPSWEGGATNSGYKVGEYIIWPHPYTDGVWMARKGGPTVPGKLGRFTSAEEAIGWAHQQMDRVGGGPVNQTEL